MAGQQGSRRRQLRRMQQGMDTGMKGKFNPISYNKKRGNRNKQAKKGSFMKKRGHSGYGITY